jgi:hypothetical protein
VDVRMPAGHAVVVKAAGLPIATDWQLRVTEVVSEE